MNQNELRKNNNLIAQHNDLIESFPEMSKNCLKLFELMVSRLDSTKEQREVKIRKDAIFKVIGKKSHHRNDTLRNILKELQKSALFHLKAATPDSKEVIISPISKVEWRERDGYIKVIFSPEILPYVTLLKGQFTQYQLPNIIKLNSKHSIALYKLLVENNNAYEYYLNKGNRSHSQLYSYSNPVISVSELRRITNTKDKYKQFASFRKFVLEKAINEINAKTDIFVNYDKIHSGHFVTDIQFHVRKKSVDANEENMKHIETVQQTKNNREMEDNKLVAYAIKSNYTQLLLENFLLTVDDLTNTAVLIGLAKNVYSKYDTIKKYLGSNGVKQHIDYVKNHIKDIYRHTNIVSYLNKAAQNYIKLHDWVEK